MKIIYFSLDYTPHDHRFLSALSETDHKVYYVRLQKGPRQTEERPVPANIEQVHWAGGEKIFTWADLPRMVLAFRSLVRRIKPDLIHAGPIQTCAFIAILSGFRPVLTMSWGFDLMKDVDRGRWWKFATRYTLSRSSYFTSDAMVTRDKALAYGMRDDRTVVFPWGVDLEHFSPGQKGVEGNQETGITLFCNRSWEPNYGVDILARAFVSVAHQNTDVSLLLLGGGSQGQVIRKILDDGGVLDRVTFAGQVSQKQLPRYYRMATLYISSSHVDGSSVSLMEALACGLPCIVSDIPANKEWVFDGENGWLFPDGDAKLLAEKIMNAINQAGTLDKIGQQARKTAEEKANWPKNVEKLLAAYTETMKYA